MNLFARSLPLLLVTATASYGEVDQASLEAEARSLAAAFIGQLKPQLQGALKAGGPVQAIEVCSQTAPAIASQMSESSGWQVKRVSLKPRNSNLATADAWEAEVMETFGRRQKAGEDPADLYASELEDGQYRYMQAQGTEAVCLMCHGEQLAPPVEAALATHYPDDVARGYSLGQVRGAISLRLSLDEE